MSPTSKSSRYRPKGRSCTVMRQRLLTRTRRSPSEQAARDDQSLDLVGAFTDDHEWSVSVIALDRKLGRVADATVNPHRIACDLERGLTREQLRHPGLDVGALAGL